MTTSTAWSDRIPGVLAIVLALVFIAAGTTKLLGLPWQVANFARWGLPGWFMYVTGAVEVLGGALLLRNGTRGWGLLLMLPTMACAILTHLQAGEAPRAIPATVFLLVLGMIALRRRRAVRVAA